MLCDGIAFPPVTTSGGQPVFRSGSSAFFMIVQESGLSYMNDAAYRLQDNGITYFGSPAGVAITGRFTSFSVAQVPLPASAGLLLAGLLGLGAARRLRAG